MDMKQPSSLLTSSRRSMCSDFVVNVCCAVALSTTLSACSKSETPQAGTDTETTLSQSQPVPSQPAPSQPADVPAAQVSDNTTPDSSAQGSSTQESLNAEPMPDQAAAQTARKAAENATDTTSAQPASTTNSRADAATGESLYVSSCKACHDAGLLNSPKLDDKAAWAPRLAQGKDTLYKHVIEGFNSMPARGGAVDASDDELKAAVDYMVSQLP